MAEDAQLHREEQDRLKLEAEKAEHARKMAEQYAREQAEKARRAEEHIKALRRNQVRITK